MFNEHSVCEREIDELKGEIKELRNLCLWSIRRTYKVYKNFAYDEYERITGDEPERD